MTTATQTTIKVKSTEAYIRKTASSDMPLFGIKADETYYLVRSSSNDGSYYPVRWDYAQIGWICPCDGFAHRHRCRHCKVSSQAAHEFASNPTLPLLSTDEAKDLIKDLSSVFATKKVRRSATRSDVVASLQVAEGVKARMRKGALVVKQVVAPVVVEEAAVEQMAA